MAYARGISMPRERLGQIYHYLCKVAGQELASGLTDGQFVERFVNQRDEAAFEVLLWRHGTMVLNVCRRILRQEQDVEDAFQATFLTFVRKARAISRREAVAGWLYKVAFRVALATKARGDKAHGRQAGDVENLADARPQTGWDDLGPVLDEEMSRLPRRYRLPVVLCYLEGKTNEEAARQLGCPAGTIFSRLARGREMLRARLTRRGLALSAGGLIGLLAANATSTALSAPLVQATIKTAMLFLAGQTLAGVSTRVMALAQGVLKAMFLTKLKTTFAVATACGLLIAGAGLLGYLGLSAAEQDPPQRGVVEPPPRAAKTPETRRQDAARLVKVVKPRPGGLERIAVQPASVEPFEQVDIYAQVAGILKNQRVDIGDKVKKEGVLAEVDAPILLTERDNAASNLESARDQVQISRALLVAAEAELKAAKLRENQRAAEVASVEATVKFRKAELQRFKELSQRGAITQQTVDEQASKLEAAERQRDAAQAGVQAAHADYQIKVALVRKATADLVARSTAVRGARSTLEKAQIMVGYSRITAPFDGVITRRNFNNGEFIRAADQAGPRPLFTLTRTDRMRVVAYVDEQDVPYTDPGDPVDLSIPALPGRKFTGHKIARVSTAIDKSSSMRVEIDVDNSGNLLRPGMNARATIHLAEASKEGMSLPLSCILMGGNGYGGSLGPLPAYTGPPAVYVIRDGKAHLREIKIGYTRQGRAEILSGLTADDVVVDSPGDAKLQGKVVPVRVK
jgi:RND family efflux transporter MFP subunit